MRATTLMCVIGWLAGCADDGTAAVADASTSPGTVSFAADVAPILKRACSASSCHGGGSGGLMLKATAVDAYHAELVGAASTQHTTLKLVEAGDTAKSYLIYKLEGTQGQFDAQCLGGSCLTPMPQGGELDEEDMGIIRAWIEAGAKND